MIKQLSEVFGVSGYENAVRDLIKKEISEYCTSIHTDSMGNLIANKFLDTNFPNITFFANIDEIGLIITDITDDGYLKFDTIGKIDISTLISKRVVINDIVGIIALKAIHLSTKKERENPIKINDLFIDIGASSKLDAKKYVRIGDYCSFDTKFSTIGEDYILGKSLGDRSACSILIDIFKKNDCNVNLAVIFAVQSEIDARGAVVVSHFLPKSNLMLLINSVNVSNTSDDTVKCGNGVAINITKPSEMSERICEIAEKENINYQRYVDINNKTLNVLNENSDKTTLIMLSIPCKYKNTAITLVNMKDTDNTQKLINAVIRRIDTDGTLK